MSKEQDSAAVSNTKDNKTDRTREMEKLMADTKKLDEKIAEMSKADYMFYFFLLFILVAAYCFKFFINERNNSYYYK